MLNLGTVIALIKKLAPGNPAQIEEIQEELDQQKTAIHGNINNDTALKNYSIGAYDTGRNVAPIVTFIDDDNNTAFGDFWPAIITAKEIPVSMAVIVGKVGNTYYGTWDDIKNYHDNYGVEVLCHSYSHLTETSDYDNMTIDEIAWNEFGRAKKILEEHGYKTDFLLYPGSSSDTQKVRIAATRYFPVAVLAGGSEINTTPLSQHNIKRYSLGHNDGQTIDLDTYKALVDECVAKNGWLLFMSHSQYNSMTSASAEVIKELIDYIRSVGADIVSVKEGFARFGNVLNVEDSSVRDGGFKVGADGKFVNSTGVGCGFATKQIHNFYSKVEAYANNNVTEERIMNNAKNFPHAAYGILRSSRTDTNLIQYFMPYGYQEVWVRKVYGDTLPAEFTCQCVPTGSYENRNSIAHERKGNAYYDETNDRIIFCKTAGKRSVDQLTVTHGATASGNIKITYAFGSKDIEVVAGDTAQDVADKIAAATGFTGHNIIQCAENPLILYLTRLLAGTTSACSFTDTDSTGVTISVSRVVTGSASAWIDAAGNTL